MRLYVAATPRLVARLLDDGLLPDSLPGFAATEALEAAEDRDASAVAGATEEELEYWAMTLASAGSLGLLAAETTRAADSGQNGAEDRWPPARVVLAVDADVLDGDGAMPPTPGAVRLAGPVSLASVASAHVDEPAAYDDVRAAIERHHGGHPEDSDPTSTRALLWYAPQELPGLVEDWRG